MLCALLLFMCVSVFCFLTLITCLCGLRVHRVIAYVMFCVLVCDLLNVRVCSACVCCVVLYGVCVCVCLLVCVVVFFLFAYVFVC